MPNTELFSDLAKHYIMHPPADWGPEVCVRGVLLEWSLIKWPSPEERTFPDVGVGTLHEQMAALLDIDPLQVNFMVYGLVWESVTKNRDLVVDMLRRAGETGIVEWRHEKVLEVA